jgi:ABC-type bacteriocin/lantibiotic exporter with double-glycine peptidase domain
MQTADSLLLFHDCLFSHGIDRRIRKRLTPMTSNIRPASDARPETMPSSVYAYIWKVSGRGQLAICLLSAVLIPVGTVPLDLQRRMVDTALGDKNFNLLILLGLLYLAAILVQQTMKYGLNLARGWVVEDVTRRLRRAIHGRKDKDGLALNGATQDPGTAVSMSASESEDIAGFVGDSISVPLVQGGTILFTFGYLAWVDWRIASLAALIYTPHYFIVRAVQQAINRLARGHAKVVRRVGHELMAEVGNPTASHRFDSLVDVAYQLRMKIYRRKFILTYLGNFLDALGPLVVLIVGGWFVIQGQAKVSTLVVFISGLQRIADPWDQLINFYRTAQIAQTKYRLFMQTLDGEAGSQSHR